MHCCTVRRGSKAQQTVRGMQERGQETVLGAVSLECSPAAGPTKFMIGTEQGPILSCNRKAKTPQDRVTGSYPGAHMPVCPHQRAEGCQG